jgi:hypothetical protein
MSGMVLHRAIQFLKWQHGHENRLCDSICCGEER